LTSNDDFFWSLSMSAVRFGDKDANAFGFTSDPQVVTVDDGIYTIFDTNSPSILISELWYDSFIAKFFGLAGVKSYEYQDGHLRAPCSAKY